MACSDNFSATLGSLLCKSRFLFLPVYTVTVDHRVVSLAATALSLFVQGRVTAGDVGAATREAPVFASLVKLYV